MYFFCFFSKLDIVTDNVSIKSTCNILPIQKKIKNKKPEPVSFMHSIHVSATWYNVISSNKGNNWASQGI